MSRSIRVLMVLAAGYLLGTASAFGQTPKDILRTDVPARIYRMTGSVRAENSSATPVSRFVFRVTIPDQASESQRVIQLSSTLDAKARKKHKNGLDEYLEFECSIEPNSVVEHDATFVVLVLPVDYSQRRTSASRNKEEPDVLDYYRVGRDLVEADSHEVTQVARQIMPPRGQALQKIRAAYEFPSKVLKFALQTEARGAVWALKNRTGDCTEHACLFQTLCRNQQIPARGLHVFNFGDKRLIEAKNPTHDISEVYMDGFGWIPVDPKMGRGRYDRPVGLGKLSNNYVLFKREGTFTWSDWLPPDGLEKSAAKPTVKRTYGWTGEVVAEGPASQLVSQFDRQFSQKR